MRRALAAVAMFALAAPAVACSLIFSADDYATTIEPPPPPHDAGRDVHAMPDAEAGPPEVVAHVFVAGGVRSSLGSFEGPYATVTAARGRPLDRSRIEAIRPFPSTAHACSRSNRRPTSRRDFNECLQRPTSIPTAPSIRGRSLRRCNTR